MSNGARGSEGSERRRMRRLVGVVATVVGLGLLALGAVSLSRPEICRSEACSLAGWPWFAAIGLFAVVAGAGIATARSRLVRRRGRGAAPSRAASASPHPGAIPTRSAATAIEPISAPVDRRGERQGAPAPEGDRDADETICPALTDWIARARRGGEGGARV